MKLSTTKIDDVNYSVNGELSSAVIEEKVQQIATKTAKNINIPGFRKGHVPAKEVLKRYKDSLIKDAEQEVLGEVFQSAIKEINKEAKDLIGEPFFKKYDKDESGIKYEFVMSFRPTVDLKGYEELIPELKISEISEKEVKERKEQMLKQFATVEKSKKQILKKGDVAKFDFEGFVDGVAFEGGKAENYMLEIGSGQFIPGFEDGMLELKVGEEREINVKFPEEYQAANLAGKDAVFKVKLHEIHTKKLPEINEELLKKLLPNEEKPSEDKLDEKIKEQLETEAKFKQIDEELKQKFVENMLAKYDFAIPQNILEQETNLQLSNAFRSLNDKEREELKDDKKLEAKREEMKEDAIKSIKLTFIVDELAKMRKIEISDQEIAQAVYFEAMRYGIDPKKHIEQYQNNGALPAVRMSLLEEKLFADIFLGEK